MAPLLAACGAFGAASDEPTSEGTTDAGTADGADGRSDGTSDGSVTPATCDATFCEGFDVGSIPFGFQATTPAPFTGAVVDGHSLPHAIEVASAENQTSLQSLSWTAADRPPPRLITVRLQTKIKGTPDGGADATIVKISCGADSFTSLKLKPSRRLQLQTSEGSAERVASDKDLPADWTSLTLSWDVGAKLITVAAGAVEHARIPATVVGCSALQAVSFGLVDWGSAPSGIYRVAFDDIVIDVK